MNKQTIVMVKPLHVSMFGSLNVAYVLGQLMYWDKIHRGEEFYNTDQEFSDQLQIGLKALRAAKDVLKRIGVVSVVLRSFPSKTYYKINSEKLDDIEGSFIQHGSLSLPKKDKQDCLQKAVQFTPNGHSSLSPGGSADAYKRQTTHYIAKINTKIKNTNNANSGSFDDPEVQDVGSSKIDLESETQNDRSPDYSHPISVAIAPSVCLEKINFEEEIQNTPPGGVDPVIGQKSSEGLLDEDFDFDPWGNSDPDPSDDPSGGSSKPDPVPEDLLDEDPWGNDGSPESMAFDKFCRNLLSKVAEVDRIRASRVDSMHAQAPLEDPSETDTPKTCHFSASDVLPLQDIKDDPKTSVACLKTPAIDMSASNIILRVSENDTYSKEPPKPLVKILEDNFAQWYAAYPKKVDKKKAFSAFTKAMKRITHEKLMRLTNSYAHSVQGKDPQYFPNPTTWLNGERWADVSLENCGGSSSSGLAPLTNSPAVDSRLQDFVNKHPNIHPAWPFLASKVIDQGDTILILAPNAFTLDSITVGGNQGYLEAYFGKRVEIYKDTPPRPQRPQNNESQNIAADYAVQERPAQEAAPNTLCQDIEVPSQTANFPYKSIGVVLQGVMQGGRK